MFLSARHLGLLTALAFSIGVAGCASTSEQAAAPAPAPAPVAAPAQPAPPPPMLTGKQLNAAVQTALNANGAHLKVDGRIGPKTRSALRSYQHKNHLRPTGRPDAATLKALGVQG